MARKGQTMEEKVMTTREKILFTSLRLFSQKGYDGVSMREIAAEVGIKGASIYSHFKGKQNILEAIFEEMTKRSQQIASHMEIPEFPEKEAAVFFEKAGEELLLQMTEGLFHIYATDEFVVMFRKLLISEQHKNAMAAKFLREYYLEAPIKYQTELFSNMQKLGAFKGYEPEIMALHFYSPVYYTLCDYDLGAPYEECDKRLKAHVTNFCKIYQ